MKNIRIGIAGACGRGSSFKLAFDVLGGIEVRAACDINAKDLPAAADRLGAAEQYTDYETMLEEADLDAVIIGTPMQLHAAQSMAALKKGVHVLSEVTAAISIEECRQLVEVCRNSDAIYMMGENYTYMRSNAIVRTIVEKGLFGTPYYAEGEYLHELKDLFEITKWRRHWHAGIAGITYVTHSLGPILQWMPGDRVVRVCCETTGSHYRDPRGDAYAQDSATMLGKMKNGGLVKIRLDVVSDRPHSMTNYQLQGTDGCYESSRGGPWDRDKIWLRSKAEDPNTWTALEDLGDEFVPDFWKEQAEQAGQAGHGGGDYFEILDFVDAIKGKRPCPIGIHEAMDMTLPGLASQQSAADGGRWVEVPDSREW